MLNLNVFQRQTEVLSETTMGMIGLVLFQYRLQDPCSD